MTVTRFNQNIGLSPTPTSIGQQYADLTRQAFKDYVRDFGPYEGDLISYSNDPSLALNAMNDAKEQVNSSFDRQAVANNDQLRGLGLTLNADEQHASDRSMDISRSLASVQAQNSVRDQVRARQLGILGAPIPTLERPTQ